MSVQGEQKSSTPDFHKEIQCMLYSFGGGKYPYKETVALIGAITHSQITEMIVKATEVSRLRGRKTMAVEDVFFLLRKNKGKLKALLRHLQTRDVAKTVKNAESADAGGCNTSPLKKRKYSLEFLNQSDQAVVESLDMDPPSIHSLERMDEMTRDMGKAEYMYYTQCRQANFHKSTTKFVEWLELSSLTDFKLSQEMIEVFGYIAYETVREIVELALQVKEDSEHSLLKPHPSHKPPSNPQFGSTPTFFTVPASSSDCSPPPSSPSPPPAERSPSPAQEFTTTSSGKRKRKQAPSTLPLATTTSLEQRHSRAIHPKHIREAYRRYQYTSGPFAPLTAHFTKSTFYKRTLCT